MKKIPKNYLMIGIFILLVIGTLVFTIRYYDSEIEKANKENRNYKTQVKQLQEENKKQRDLIERQDKDVVTKEEEDIREQAKKFINILFTLKQGEAFKEKEKSLAPLLDEKYQKDLFENTRGKNNVFGKVEVSNIKTFIEEYRPQNETYDVYVQFDEKIQDVDEEEATTKKTSGKIHFIRKNGKWLIDNFERFTLERNKSADSK
ncbi:transposon-related protein [Staphylococcus aureus]|uniref:hypothetical protein n=1 Tax=Staphylococcus aureus TaxID=1280 RepID=UPI000768E25A|nr:hypothetical protein [Staphylococcus aureus]CAC6893903.1 transposon-related protein [Staphylococcus aureus]CAC6909324.1 transposon-related protein [Staphylococcus aureus]CAC7100565.1 transposon-related protein [Staphylococcus aureus]CAC7157990.1 transposon-related protein [Staphylococcus aureus]CAC8676951.1 transposon-related protein [Staphylococcus aureus]